MSRIVDAPINVALGPDGSGGLQPAAFYRQERHRIKVVLDTRMMVDWLWWEDPEATRRGPSL